MFFRITMQLKIYVHSLSSIKRHFNVILFSFFLNLFIFFTLGWQLYQTNIARGGRGKIYACFRQQKVQSQVCPLPSKNKHWQIIHIKYFHAFLSDNLQIICRNLRQLRVPCLVSKCVIVCIPISPMLPYKCTSKCHLFSPYI